MDAVARLSAIEDIRQLKSRYFRCVDRKDWTGLRAVFCDDACFDARDAGALPGEAGEGADWCPTGASAIVDFVRAVVEPVVTAHHGHDHAIEILDEHRARGTVALEDWIWSAAGPNGALVLHGWGFYEEEYRRDAAGWRISRSVLSRINIRTD